MPNNLRSIEKRELANLLIISCRKYPKPITFGFKVFGFNPVVAFVGMSAFRPFP